MSVSTKPFDVGGLPCMKSIVKRFSTMDYYEPRDDLDEPPFHQTELSPIQKLFEGTDIFITGASGFMGKVLMEKILRTCNVGRLYVMVREKKGIKSQERLASIFNDRLFEPLRLLKPDAVSKVTCVVGDCSLPDLGLSPQDRARLAEVSIVFHAAATLYMDQHLRVAFNTNVTSTKVLLEFAKTLPRLKAFMYVSTAYTHAYRDLVEEMFYNVELDENEISQLCSQLDDQQIGALTPKLISRWTNTYALTKACAENLVSKYEGVLPIGVVRPSIVVSVWNEPLKGWINNVYGAVGVVAGTALGLLRVWCAEKNFVGDMIPVDVAINMTLAATWEVAVNNTHMKIYNLVSSPMNPITYDILRTANLTHKVTEPLDTTKAIAPQNLSLIPNKTLFCLASIWYHVIPAFFIDWFLQLTGKKPQLMKVYTKIYNVNKALMPYCAEKEIVFTADNVKQLWNSLHPIDKQLFNMDLTHMDWHWFWLNGLKGMRVYLVNDPMETVPEGIKHSRRLQIRKAAFDSVWWITISSMAYYFSKDFIHSLW